MVIGFGLRPDGFDLLVLFVSPFMWTFLALIGMAVFLFRAKGLVHQQTWRTPLFPLTPILFISSSGFMVYRSLTWLKFKIESEKTFIEKALLANDGKINRTVANANIPKNTLLRKIKKFNIDLKKLK